MSLALWFKIFNTIWSWKFAKPCDRGMPQMSNLGLMDTASSPTFTPAIAKRFPFLQFQPKSSRKHITVRHEGFAWIMAEDSRIQCELLFYQLNNKYAEMETGLWRKFLTRDSLFFDFFKNPYSDFNEIL